MKRIVVATDFSSRSDAAVQRAAQLASHFAATLRIVHVVDADLPPRLVEAERGAAAGLLDELAVALRASHRLECVVSVVTADEAFVGVLQTAHDDGADLLVVGAHRRRILLDIFVGTTAERIIRKSTVPVLMANSPPLGGYRHALIAVDLSETSNEALLAARRLDWLGAPRRTALHVFDTPATSLLARTGVDESKMQASLAQEHRRAHGELRALLERLEMPFVDTRVAPLNEDTSVAIRRCANDEAADVVVVATHGRGGIAKVLLGTVAQELLRSTEQDVLVAPLTKTR